MLPDQPSCCKWRLQLKLHLANSTEKNVFTGYGSGYVTVNQNRYESSLIVMPKHIIKNWEVQAFEHLSEKHFEQLIPAKPEIVLLGTGQELRFPSPEIIRKLIEIKIGVEVMDTNAACRTYNILMEEGRNIAAALLI
tara:strand:+ start:4180 stop:4590 length:411 start_codon:yes stop_codon:yes gene_type:complete